MVDLGTMPAAAAMIGGLRRIKPGCFYVGCCSETAADFMTRTTRVLNAVQRYGNPNISATTAAPLSLRDRLRTQLGYLKMPGALASLDDILRQVDGGQLAAGEAISTVLHSQIRLRNQRRLQTAMRSARLPAVKTLDDFDVTFQPSIKRESGDKLPSLLGRPGDARRPSSLCSHLHPRRRRRARLRLDHGDVERVALRTSARPTRAPAP